MRMPNVLSGNQTVLLIPLYPAWVSRLLPSGIDTSSNRTNGGMLHGLGGLRTHSTES